MSADADPIGMNLPAGGALYFEGIEEWLVYGIKWLKIRDAILRSVRDMLCDSPHQILTLLDRP